jgi:hypothetical protein
MTRAVLDANVFVSGILNAQGLPGRILDAWRADQFHLLISHAILQEIERVFQYPKIARRHQWSNVELCNFLAELTSFAVLTPGDFRVQVIAECPADDRYLECAMEGNAAYVVSGDRHLLQLKNYQGITIVPPRIFMDILER